jgi:flagellar basal-body rod protein FlgF
MGEGGPITIPPDSRVTIARDGTVSTIPTVGAPNITNTVGRIKLVDPAEASLQRGEDGLFRMRDGTVAPADPNVAVASGALERSNVNVVAAITEIINHGRQFELQVRMLQSADQNARSAAQVLAISA